jgi:hypothetical protein
MPPLALAASASKIFILFTCFVICFVVCLCHVTLPATRMAAGPTTERSHLPATATAAGAYRHWPRRHVPRVAWPGVPPLIGVFFDKKFRRWSLLAFHSRRWSNVSKILILRHVRRSNALLRNMLNKLFKETLYR